jgi:hypothetical protein
MVNIALQAAAWLAIYCALAFQVEPKKVPGGAGMAVCTNRGRRVKQATIECCEQIDQAAYVNPVTFACWANGGPWHAGIRYDAFSECCKRRPDAGSSASNRHSLLKLGIDLDPVFPVWNKDYDGPGSKKWRGKGTGKGKGGKWKGNWKKFRPLNRTHDGSEEVPTCMQTADVTAPMP